MPQYFNFRSQTEIVLMFKSSNLLAIGKKTIPRNFCSALWRPGNKGGRQIRNFLLLSYFSL